MSSNDIAPAFCIVTKIIPTSVAFLLLQVCNSQTYFCCLIDPNVVVQTVNKQHVLTLAQLQVQLYASSYLRVCGGTITNSEQTTRSNRYNCVYTRVYLCVCGGANSRYID